MSLFEGTAPPNVKTTATTTAEAPEYLTSYLTKLASEGEGMLGKTGAELIAPESSLLTSIYESAPTTLERYQSPLDAALTAGQAGAAGITAEDISTFYNPYQQNVIDAMGRQSLQNVQRNVLPALRSAFAGSGGFGSQRYAGATGQTIGDIGAALQNEQAKKMYEGYTSALDAALKQKGIYNQAAGALTNLGTAEQQAAASALKTQAELGQLEQAYDQSVIDAPLVRAENVAKIMRGYTYPTTTTEVREGPASSYGPSPLATLTSLGTMIAGLKPDNPLVKAVTGALKNFVPGTSEADWYKWAGVDTQTEYGGTVETPNYEPVVDIGEDYLDYNPI